MEWNGPGRVNLNPQEPTEVHLDFKQYLLRQEEHLTDLISLRGGKCKIFIECEQLKWNGQTPCSIISHEGQNCKAVVHDFRDFIRDNDIIILIS
jgi:Fe-S-cluster containining protein